MKRDEEDREVQQRTTIQRRQVQRWREANKEEGKQVNEVFTTKYQNRHVSLIGRRPTNHCTWVKHMSLRGSLQAWSKWSFQGSCTVFLWSLLMHSYAMVFFASKLQKNYTWIGKIMLNYVKLLNESRMMMMQNSLWGPKESGKSLQTLKPASNWKKTSNLCIFCCVFSWVFFFFNVCFPIFSFSDDWWVWLAFCHGTKVAPETTEPHETSIQGQDA